MNNTYKIAYFGGEPLGVPVLQHLLDIGYTPSLVVTSPDKPAGRNLVMTPPPVKQLARNHGITILQPDSYHDQEAFPQLTDTDWDLFIVVAYNHILPQWVLELPAHKTINLHPSLLPKLRGPSPIRTALLEDQTDALGVTIMVLTPKMDQGPIIAQEPYVLNPTWPLPGQQLDMQLAERGAKLLAATLPAWLNQEITPREQAHTDATYTKKFTKDMGEVDLDPHQLPTGEAAYRLYLKFCAFDGIGGIYFFHNNKRIKITKASLTRAQQFVVEQVIPEGKREQPFAVWKATI